MNLRSVFYSCIAGFVLFFMGHTVFGQGTAFSYQGQLSSGGSSANGTYDFIFTLYPGATTNATVPGTIPFGSVTNSHVAVNNGLFTTTLDFGPGAFTGSNFWLQISVESITDTTFTVLQPLQPVLPVPYAIFANSASNLVGQLPASQLSGTLPASAFVGYTNTVALTNGANLFAGAFYGNGGAVTNVNATNIVGILSDAQLPANAALLNSNQTFAAGVTNTFNGVNIFTNLYGNSFSGSFFGNGLVGWIVVPGTFVQASIDTGYLLTNSQMVTVSLPATAHAGDVVRIAYAGATGWQLEQVAGQYVVGNFLNFGTTWYQSDVGAFNWTSIASSSDGTRMVAAAYNSGLYTSVDSGRSWSSGGSAIAWTGVASSSDGTRLAGVASANAIYTSTNSGTSWQAQLSVPAMYGIASSANGSCLVAGAYDSDIVISTNGGTSGSWFDGKNSGGSANLVEDWNAVASSSSGSQMYAACNPGFIYNSSNYGGNWTQSGSVSADWVSIASSADGTKLIAAYTNSGGGIYISTNSGTSWTSVAPSLPSSAFWAGVASSSDGSKLVGVANGGGIYTSSNWGNTWQTNNTLTAHWSCVTASSAGTALAAGIDNTLSTSGLYGIYYGGAISQTTSTVGIGGHISGGQGSSVELQCIGNNNYMPVSYCGTIWAQ